MPSEHIAARVAEIGGACTAAGCGFWAWFTAGQSPVAVFGILVGVASTIWGAAVVTYFRLQRDRREAELQAAQIAQLGRES